MVEFGRWFRGWRVPALGPQKTRKCDGFRRLRLEPLEDRRLLAILTITSLDDNLTVDGKVTLREAIRAAELNISVDGSVAGAGADTIEFHPSLSGAIHLSSAGDHTAGASAFSITTPIHIHGNANGITITRSIVGPEMRFFHVTATGNLTLDSLALTAGIARGEDGVPGDPHGADGRGGAIFNEGQLQVIGCTLYGNEAHGGAAAIGGTSGAGRGGAIFNGNVAMIRNSTISTNAARNSDGTSVNQAFGGGVLSRNGIIEIDFCTIVDNLATAGRGVYVLGDGIDKSSSLELNNSIVGNNGPAEEATDVVVTFDNSGAAASGGTNNLVRKEIGFAGGIVSNLTPKLGPLADNGGPTSTHAILAGSPAIEAGNVLIIPGQDGVPLSDQRGSGFARAADGDGALGVRVDIGAFELQASAPIIELPGDYNLNGIVDAADYTVWRDQLNQPVAAFSGADGDGSGFVDALDYNVWKLNFGDTASLASASVATLTRQVEADASETALLNRRLLALPLLVSEDNWKTIHRSGTRSLFQSAAEYDDAELLNLLALANVELRATEANSMNAPGFTVDDCVQSSDIVQPALAEPGHDWHLGDLANGGPFAE